jgi:CDP-glucose 4,6-dehydratase
MDVTAPFAGAFAGQRVLVTGDTGFKGAWLCAWLRRLGADVWGCGLAPETTPSLFDVLSLADNITHRNVDVRNADAVRAFISEAQPTYVFHLAAQALVRRSYEDPVVTFATNVMGTAHVLEAIRHTPSVRVAIIVTTDKVYENQGWHWAYRETDALGGHDPYSASKAAAEMVVSSYRRSYFEHGPLVVSARAGNVVGGGDWAPDRLVPDLVRALEEERPLELRNPRATRPWQHVLDASSGYLHLAARLFGDAKLVAHGAWNFGPDDAEPIPVAALAEMLARAFGRGAIVDVEDATAPHEARDLRLDSSAARRLLGWRPAWATVETVNRTAQWYSTLLREGPQAAAVLTPVQIDDYTAAAVGLASWAPRTTT